MHEHENGKQPRQNESVKAVKARESCLANTLASSEELDHEITDYRDCSGYPRNDFDSPVPDLVPWQGISSHPERHGDDGHDHASDPGEFAGTLETAGQVDTEDVQDQHQDHHAGAPTVDGANQPAKTHISHQVLHRGIGLSNSRLVIKRHRKAACELDQETRERDSPEAIKNIDVRGDILGRDVIRNGLDLESFVEPLVDRIFGVGRSR